MIALPAADVAEPFLDVDDVADVAVAMLTRDGHAGRTYELTGPRLLTFADVAAELTRATGREIGYLPVTAAQYADAALAAGVPAEEIGPLSELFAEEGVESVAVCLFNSFLDAVHEHAAGARFAASWAGKWISLSSEVMPTMGEYERSSTAVVIERKTGAAGTYAVIFTTTTAAANTYTDNTVAANTTYVYRVKATSATALPSPYSAEVTVTTPQVTLAAPTGLQVTSNTAAGVGLSWINSVGSTAVRIERRLGTGAYALLATTTTAARSYSSVARSRARSRPVKRST